MNRHAKKMEEVNRMTSKIRAQQSRETIARNYTMTMTDDGEISVRCCGLYGTCSRTGNGSWVWNIHENETTWHADAFGGCESQYEAYGELLCRLFDMTT